MGNDERLVPGDVYLRAIGEAIVSAKTFIILLSSKSVKSKYCQDEISLAYISNKSIFAVPLLPYDEINQQMDLGIKLTLACVQWTFLSPQLKEDEFTALSASVKAAVTNQPATDIPEEVEEEIIARKASLESNESNIPINNGVMNQHAVKMSATRLHKRTSFQSLNVDQLKDSLPADMFWSRYFQEKRQVPWAQFLQTMKDDMVEVWEELKISSDQLKSHKFFNLIEQEMNVTNGLVNKKDFMSFCRKGKNVFSLDEAVRLYAVQIIAVREVFEIDSSVRLTAIENLGGHQSKAVVRTLLDLLYDDEADVRAVSAVSLAHAASEIINPQIRSEVLDGLILCLKDSDRLVRESGCLALGRMKSKTAIKELVHLWRNDYISTVREAGHIAIKQIGGEEAENALRVTQVLSDEIASLKN